MCIATLCGLDQLVYDVLWRRLIGVTHTKVNDIFAPGAGFLLELSCNIEDVRRETVDSCKMVVHSDSKNKGARRPSLKCKRACAQLLLFGNTQNLGELVGCLVAWNELARV